MKMFLDIEPGSSSALPKADCLHRRWAVSVFALVRNQSNCWLLVQQRQRGRWNLLGGRVRPGEALREALAREFREETGRLLVGPTRLAGLVEDPVRMRLFLFFRATTNPCIPMTLTNTEISEIGWFSVTAVPELKCKALRAWLQLGAWGQPLSRFRWGNSAQRWSPKGRSSRWRPAKSHRHLT